MIFEINIKINRLDRKDELFPTESRGSEVSPGEGCEHVSDQGEL
jgi:hypothetical protein